MRFARQFLRFCLSIISLTYVQSEVIQLATNNVSQYLNNHVTFIKFYANWCPHSKKFEPTWKRFADMKQNSDLHVAEIDCSSNALLCSDHDIFGYPTVKLFVRGSGARYEGPRQIESLESFYREKLAEDANFEDTITTKKTIVELTKQNFAQLTSKGFTFAVFHAPWCKFCKLLMPIFQELAKQMSNTEDLIFAAVDCTLESSLCSEHAIQGYPTLIWFENGREKDRYVDDREINRMRNYIEQKLKEARPLSTPDVVKQVTEEEVEEQQQAPEETDQPTKVATVLNAKTFTQGVSFEGYAFINFGAPWCSHCQKLSPIWDRLASKLSDIEEIRISRVDCTASESLCRDYGVRAFPTLILFRYGESKVEYNGGRDLVGLYNFLVNQMEYFGDEYILKKDE